MYDERLPTNIWVQAGLALCSSRGIPVAVMHKGDPHTGIVLVKIVTLDGACRLLTQQRNIDGELAWIDAIPRETSPSEGNADAYIERARGRDPDLWVIELEDREARNPFDVDGA